MDFDKPKVYGDTFISDGLVFMNKMDFPAKYHISVSDVDNNEVSDTKLTAVIQSYEKQVSFMILASRNINSLQIS